MSIKGVFFDAADVFYARLESTEACALRMAKADGLPGVLPPADRSYLRELHGQASAGIVSYQSYWDEALARMGVDPARRAGYMEQIVAAANRVYALPGAAASVAALKERGFVVGVVTDTMYPLAWKMDWLVRVGVEPYIDLVACSSALGTHKPDPAIYLDALSRAALAAGEAVFVGHDPGELEGARRVGLTTIAVRGDPGARADYYAGSLLEMIDLPILARAGEPAVE